MFLSPPSNTKHSVDQPCTHDIPLNTKHNVDLYHALTPMSCDVLVHNSINHAIAHSYHATYMMSAICACLLMHNYPSIIWTFILKKTYKFQVYHTIYAIISIHANIDITSYYYSSRDIHQPLGRIMTRHVYN